MAQKPSIPKGTRDFSPAEVAKRNYIFSTIKTNFEKFGFQPIETPSFENSETLMGKYGEEGDRLIFKILNSGDYFSTFNRALAVYFKVVFSRVIKEIYKDSDLNSVERFKEILTSKDFIDFIVEEVNKTKNEEYKIQDFYNDSLKKLLEDQIDFLKNSNLLNQLFEEKSNVVGEYDFDNNKKLQSLIDNLVENTLGKWLKNVDSKDLTKQISEKALRYDLTVPFARYVVQHQNEIEFPFKRYQIQPVWRADRPQKGRFREFYQCDADVVGSNSLWQEVELVQLYDSVFSQLGLGGVTIKINNRKILSGIAEVIGASDKLIDFTVALDKLDKIGEDGVKKEMLEKGISETAIEKVQPLFNFTGTINEKIEKLANLLANSEEGMKGVNELQFICDNVTTLGLQTAFLDLDVTLARGLNYYTGAIFEVAAPKGVAMGSIGGGGRYDDLTGIFGLKNMSGVGISFGLDRIALVMEEVGLFPEAVLATSKALFLNFGDKEALYAMKAIGKLRQKGIKVELYPDKSKIDKQFKHADRRGIPFAVIVGESEMEREEFGLKNLATGEQQKVDFATLVTLLQ
ncbi:histidine--tRNA ligase [Flavobacterium celericrescens]|uniref:Histidine--tRNA ligase n=1 Tax=Flavobacterium celericrescens TaxID=2709780 RepID=A0ABX0IDP3_9FLAO|nr:histidine--tRNA ligase [Flavobacterium celericrescens]NHM03989.1 histidine--tRNA ligase [Flavobacterium celericrescens]